MTGGQGVGQFVAMIDVLLTARRLLPLLLPLSVSACAEKVVASDTAPCQLQRLAVLPYQINHGHPVVDAQIDGKPASFIFDTGAFTTVLTPAAAKRLGLRQDGAASGEVIGLGGTRATRHYRANELRLGILHGEAWNFLSADILGGRPEEQPDGSLGADLLQQYDIDMDVPAHKIILYYPQHDCSQPSVFMHGALYRTALLNSRSEIEGYVPDPLARRPMLETVEYSSPQIMVLAYGKPLVAEIDTGSPQSFIYKNGAARLALNRDVLARDKPIVARGIGPNAVPGAVHRLVGLQIGELELQGMPIEVVSERSFDGTDMVIGLDVLALIHVWISHSSHQVVLQYPPVESPGP